MCNREKQAEKEKVYDGFRLHCQKSLKAEKHYKFGLLD